MTAAAFFDVDNTLVRGSTMYFMGRGLIARRVFTPMQVAEVFLKQARFLLSGAERGSDLAVIVSRAQELVRGRQVSDVVRFGEQIFEQRIVGRLWPEAIELVGEHRAAGREVWLVTSTGQEMADMIAGHIDVTGALGTRSETKDGVYTGRLAGPVMHGKAKAQAVEDLAKSEGIDLGASFAYSDSANDIPMLSLVGNPVVVNPDGQLRRHAMNQGWQIMDFRSPSRIGRALVAARKARPRLPLP